MARAWMWFVVPFVAVLGGAGAVWGLSSEGMFAASAPLVEVTFDELDPHVHRHVRLRGTAHYPSLIRQTVPSRLMKPEAKYFVYGFFPENDTDNREIRYLVRTQREPEKLVSYEVMTVQGVVRRRTRDIIPYDTEVLLGRSTEYFFGDEVWVIEPTRIESADGVWDEP